MTHVAEIVVDFLDCVSSALVVTLAEWQSRSRTARIRGLSRSTRVRCLPSEWLAGHEREYTDHNAISKTATESDRTNYQGM